jgi:hypothetical protein
VFFPAHPFDPGDAVSLLSSIPSFSSFPAGTATFLKFAPLLSFYFGTSKSGGRSAVQRLEICAALLEKSRYHPVLEIRISDDFFSFFRLPGHRPAALARAGA